MTKTTIIALSASLFMTVASGAAETQLELEFPPPFLSGTPVPINVPNLEPVDAPPPTIMVPEGVENIALEKEVTSSDDFPIIGDLELITDGDKESEEGYFVEIAQDLQWVQIDLEKSATLYGIGVWHFHSQKRSYIDMIVQVSNDSEFKEGVTTLYNNDHDNSAGMGVGKNLAYIETNKGKLIDANEVEARYVRLYSNGNTSNEMNHYVEVEVFGAY